MGIGCPMKIIARAVDANTPVGPWQIVHTRNGSRLPNILLQRTLEFIQVTGNVLLLL
ncbi:hypothetical protein F441_22821 [Phytophthora nicotianae CJ01A1]|uniref:Uncharacterized protein n=1 Tax=Phytophthora nicotianae CJ01A1 TaxID=1317063 RepID=W2VND4_PHYNI|nr:hypothetical protein F441_22821 [Phytophthora nicotianae CJ01A1]